MELMVSAISQSPKAIAAGAAIAGATTVAVVTHGTVAATTAGGGSFALGTEAISLVGSAGAVLPALVAVGGLAHEVARRTGLEGRAPQQQAALEDAMLFSPMNLPREVKPIESTIRLAAWLLARAGVGSSSQTTEATNGPAGASANKAVAGGVSAPDPGELQQEAKPTVLTGTRLDREQRPHRTESTPPAIGRHPNTPPFDPVPAIDAGQGATTFPTPKPDGANIMKSEGEAGSPSAPDDEIFDDPRVLKPNLESLTTVMVAQARLMGWTAHATPDSDGIGWTIHITDIPERTPTDPTKIAIGLAKRDDPIAQHIATTLGRWPAVTLASNNLGSDGGTYTIVDEFNYYPVRSPDQLRVLALGMKLPQHLH